MSTSTYLRGTMNTTATSQSEPVVGKNQVKNNAGGYVFKIDPWARLPRFLVLGSSGNTYQTSTQLSLENAKAILDLIKEDGLRVVNTVLEMAYGQEDEQGDFVPSNRVPKQDPALFALAMAMSFGDHDTKVAAKYVLPKVARIGTHVLHEAPFLEQFGGWNRTKRDAVASWFTNMPERQLALQAIKYNNRDGWTLADLLRLSHPKPDSEARAAIFRYMSYGVSPDSDGRGKKVRKFMPFDRFSELVQSSEALSLIAAAEAIKSPSANEADVIKAIRDYNLPREAIPTKFLKERDVWEALLMGPNGKARMPYTAMLRNLGVMSARGLIEQGSDTTKAIINELTNTERLKSARIHPLQLLVALKMYAQGHGDKGDLKWTPIGRVSEALNDAFYASFSLLEPTGLTWDLWTDVSGSMSAKMNNLPISYAEASAAMAMVAFRTEKDSNFWGFHTTGMHVDVGPNERLDSVVRKISDINWGGTDCSVPMTHAKKHNRKADIFVVYTDNETWAGAIHPFQALKQYRANVNPNAKLAVLGMAANPFSIADPNDAGMMDFVGFDTAVPRVLTQFAKGEI